MHLIFEFLKAIIKTRLGRYGLLVVLFLLWIWLWNIPIVRLSYGGIIVPWRSLQYYLSSHRSDTIKLEPLFYYGRSSSTKRLLQRIGAWAVLKSLRERGLSIEEQAIALAIVAQESTFHPLAKNKSSSACGLYQLIAATGLLHELPWWRCMDPLANARAGTALFIRYKADSTIFSERLRCSYLKHYYGLATGCSSDPTGIWNKVSKRMTRDANLARTILTEIHLARHRESLLRFMWRSVEPFLPIGILIVAVLFLRSLFRQTPRAQANH